MREGLTAVISVKVHDAQFEGQTKTKLGNSEVRGLVESTIGEKLQAFLEENPSVARTIIDKAMTASRAREAAKRARELTRRKTALESSALPGKLADCSEKDPTYTEIYIVEETRREAVQNKGVTGHIRQFFPFGAKCLTLKKQG